MSAGVPRENWRDSEVQMIGPRAWHRLNGTDAEILIPDAKAATLIRVRRARSPGDAGTDAGPPPAAEGSPGGGPVPLLASNPAKETT